jgi:uncharacterized RDD family membrane protein YckC
MQALSLVAPALWRRMACWLYEGVLMFGVVFIAGGLFDVLSQSRQTLANRPLRMAFLFIVFGLYFSWCWPRGQTLAQKTWRIRVVDAAGQPLTPARACLRYALCWLWFLPPLMVHALGVPLLAVLLLLALWVIVWALASRIHPLRQFWHDALAATRLIDERPAPQP